MGEPKAFRFWVDVDLLLFWPVRMMFALKPAIDALSILLFLGEYRQMSLSGFAAIKSIVSRSSTSSTKVVHVQSVTSTHLSSTVMHRISKSAPR